MIFCAYMTVLLVEIAYIYLKKIGTPGVDVMITVFFDFCQFSEKLAFLSKTNVMIKISKKTSCSLSQKRQYFR
jgi:hypothetical protein